MKKALYTIALAAFCLGSTASAFIPVKAAQDTTKTKKKGTKTKTKTKTTTDTTKKL